MLDKKINIVPSILASNFLRLGKEIEEVSKYVEAIHLDVMDGSFVNNISFGPQVIKALRKCTDLPFDVHLMIENPIKYIDEFVSAGADIITFHIEALKSDEDVRKIIDSIKRHEVSVGISIKPTTPVEKIIPYLEDSFMILIMTVDPGFGGQKFIESQVDKISLLKKEIERRKLNVKIEVDGGINKETIGKAYKAGASIFVAGTSVFGQSDYNKAVEDLKNGI